jgi:nicotinate dehydrogenase subunit A
MLQSTPIRKQGARAPAIVGEAFVATITLKVNGQAHTVTAEPDTPLLYILRNDIGLSGPKFGCGLAQCGACTVIAGDRAVRSCSVPVSAAAEKDITTVEGLGTPERPHPLQAAFVAEQAAQCGYCISGMIMQAKAILDRNPKASDGEIRQGMAGNLCRCGTHTRIMKAIKRAAKGMGA